MTTYEHSIVAGAAAILASGSPQWVKLLVLLGLVVIHPALDAIPHLHWYSFDNLKQDIQGAIIELGGGLILVPLLIWRLSNIDLLWLMACVVAASLFDFLVAARIPFIKHLNHAAHFWEHNDKTSFDSKLRWEFVTLTICGIAVIIIGLFHRWNL